MGLRPLWLVETAQAYYVSSEKGIAPLVDMVADPKPLAPGEKIGVQVNRGAGARLLHHYTMQYEVQQRAQMHGNHPDEMRRFITCGGPEVGKQSTHESFEVEPGGAQPAFDPKQAEELRNRLIAAYAWDSEDLK